MLPGTAFGAAGAIAASRPALLHQATATSVSAMNGGRRCRAGFTREADDRIGGGPGASFYQSVPGLTGLAANKVTAACEAQAGRVTNIPPKQKRDGGSDARLLGRPLAGD